MGTGAEKTMQRASGTGIRVTAARQSMQQREEVRPCTSISSRLLPSPGSGEYPLEHDRWINDDRILGGNKLPKIAYC